jgi:hypothetical protein
MRGAPLSKNAAVPFAVSPCHRRSSPSSISAAINETMRPLKRFLAILKPVSYLHVLAVMKRQTPCASGGALVYSRDGFQMQLELRVVNGRIHRPQVLRDRHAVLNHGGHRRYSALAYVPLQSGGIFVCPHDQLTMQVQRRLVPALSAQLKRQKEDHPYIFRGTQSSYAPAANPTSPVAALVLPRQAA